MLALPGALRLTRRMPDVGGPMELMAQGWAIACMVAGAVVDWGMSIARALAERTGLPVVLAAAMAVAVSYRVARRAWRLVFQVSVVALALVVATELDWLSW